MYSKYRVNICKSKTFSSSIELAKHAFANIYSKTHTKERDLICPIKLLKRLTIITGFAISVASLERNYAQQHGKSCVLGQIMCKIYTKSTCPKTDRYCAGQ